MTDFVVVGGGIAGLVLARRLALGGKTVTLLEASDHLGGTVTRHEVGGIDLDAGAESFATRGGTVAALATALGLGGEIVEPNPAGAWLQPAVGPAFRLPENSLLGIPGSPLATDVTPIIGTRAAWRAYSEIFLPGTYAANSKTIGELVRKRMGGDVLDKLVRPVVRGVHSADVDNLPVDRVAPGLRGAMRRTGSLSHAVLDLRMTLARAGSAVAGIRGGIARLVDELEADLVRFGVDLRLNARVTSVEPDRAMVDSSRVDGRVVVAAPSILRGKADSGTRVVLATLVVDEPSLDAAPRGTGVLVAEGAEGIRAKALTHATAKWEWLARRANGKHVLRLSYDDDHENLAEVAREDASRLLGVRLATSTVLDFARVEWYRPKVVDGTPDEIPLAGESIAGTGLASVVAQAESLAGSLLGDAEG
ncbi:MAG TPA: FAD-dependent oxidoreductase [Galbitalea sp.]